MVFDDVKEDELNRNVASQARMMPLMEVLRFVFGRIEGKPQEGGERNQADNEPAQEDGFGHGVCARNKKGIILCRLSDNANPGYHSFYLKRTFIPMQTQAIIRHIVQWLKDYAEQARAKGFVVGVSGGIDSAVVSTLAAQTGLSVLCWKCRFVRNPTKSTARKNT